MEDEKKLDQEAKTIWSNVVFDGVTDWSRFNRAKHRILWILKEANQSDNKSDDNHREFHKDVTIYKDWKKTFTNLTNVSYGILNCEYNYNSIDSTRIDKKVSTTNDVAIININKSGGGARCKLDLEKYYEDQKIRSHILSQVSMINPQIIIVCNHIVKLLLDVSSAKEHGEFINDKTGCKYFYKNNRLVIDAYHPNATELTQEQYFTSIISAYMKTVG